VQFNKQIKRKNLELRVHYCVSQLQLTVGLSGTYHVNYPVIKTFKLAEQKESYKPKPTWEEYGSILFKAQRMQNGLMHYIKDLQLR
jgi:hypothetical protein